ncbi:anthranilate synthase component I, partial [Vibrio sp. Vb2880]|nr:anthranilate synthase component I [Vibrio sp. Vb2880]
TVSLHPLTTNGRNLLAHLTENMRGDDEGKFDGETLTLQFNQPCDTLDEDSRLREASSFDALRLVQHSFDISQQDKHAIFLGG